MTWLRAQRPSIPRFTQYSPLMGGFITVGIIVENWHERLNNFLLEDIRHHICCVLAGMLEC